MFHKKKISNYYLIFQALMNRITFFFFRRYSEYHIIETINRKEMFLINLNGNSLSEVWFWEIVKSKITNLWTKLDHYENDDYTPHWNVRDDLFRNWKSMIMNQNVECRIQSNEIVNWNFWNWIKDFSSFMQFLSYFALSFLSANFS
jgi:hypothetical protein